MDEVYLPPSADGADDDALDATLDYMAGLFDASTDVPQILGGDAGALLQRKMPDGDYPINVSEFHAPAHGLISSGFGFRKNFKRFHNGIDIALHKGDTVRAAFPGTVSLTKFDPKGYGYYIIMTHPNGLQTFYAHLDHFLVVPSAKVEAGEPIAIGGVSGNSTGPHLHFETRFRAVPVNPSDIIDTRSMRPRSATYVFRAGKSGKTTSQR